MSMLEEVSRVNVCSCDMTCDWEFNTLACCSF